MTFQDLLQRKPWAVMRCPACGNDAVVGTRGERWPDKDPSFIYCAKAGCEHGYLGMYLEIGECPGHNERIRLQRLASTDGYRFELV